VHLRVLVYNVRSLRAGPRTVAALVAEHSPDVALIQECGPRYRLRRFADALRMEPVSAHALMRRSIHNAVLLRSPWRVLSSRLHRFPKDARLYPRGALLTRIGRAGFRVWVVSFHLGLHPGARRRNADELASILLPLPEPVVVGGDMNEGPDGKAAIWMSQRFWDCFEQSGEGSGETYPARDPRARIDYLFVNDGLEVERALVLHAPHAAGASDHLPLLVDLRIPMQQIPVHDQAERGRLVLPEESL
jgi:endonuclease/exonuclease/phosphatase family metal-dependent hydrolase